MALTLFALRPVDRLLLGYLAVATLVALRRVTDHRAAAWVVLINLLIGALVLLLARQGRGRMVSFLREWFPLLLLPVLYGSLDLLNALGQIRVHDDLVLAAERAIFGGEPAREWWQRYPSQFLSTVLHSAYWSYYLILALPVAWFGTRANRPALERTVLWLTASFVICYLCFLFFPVAGPYYMYPRPSDGFLDNPMARLVYGTLAVGSSHGAAFPSSHVAAALVVLAATYRDSRLAGHLLLVPVVLLVVSVVYCQMHYAVDALAGVLVACLVVGVGVGSEKREARGKR